MSCRGYIVNWQLNQVRARESGWKVRETKEEESEWHTLGRNWPEKRKQREQSSCGDKTFWKDGGGWERLQPKDWDGQVVRWLTHSFTFTYPLLLLFDSTHISAVQDLQEYTEPHRNKDTECSCTTSLPQWNDAVFILNSICVHLN